MLFIQFATVYYIFMTKQHDNQIKVQKWRPQRDNQREVSCKLLSSNEQTHSCI